MAWTKLDIAPGVFSDDSNTTSEGRYVDAREIRFVRGLPQTVRGYESAILSDLTGYARGIHVWQLTTGETRIAVGTHTNLYVLKGGAWYDITPVGLTAGRADGTGPGGYGTGSYGTGGYGSSSVSTYYPRTWCFANVGDNLLANPRGGTIYKWTGSTGTPAAQLTNAPTRVEFFFLDPAGEVVALATNETSGGAYNAMLVRHCDQTDNTNWTAASTNTAGEFPLRDGSRLVGGIPGNNGVNALWTDSNFITQTRLGDAGLVYHYDVRGAGGLIAPHAAVLAPNGYWHWWGSDGQFYRSAGGPPEPIPNPNRDLLNDNLAPVQQDKIWAGLNSQYNEIVFFYPDNRDGIEVSRCARLNYTDLTWSLGRRARTCWFPAGVTTAPVAVSTTGRLYYEEVGYTADGGVLTSDLTSGYVDIGDGDTIMEIQGFRPDFSALQGTVSIYIYGKMSPQDTPVTYGPYSVNSTTTQLNFLITARQAAVKFTSSASPSYWRLGQPRWDVVDTGDRY